MTLSIQEISDRLEIQDLIARYSYALDRRDYDALERSSPPMPSSTTRRRRDRAASRR